jgi:predicted ATP-dependent serine protease
LSLNKIYWIKRDFAAQLMPNLLAGDKFYINLEKKVLPLRSQIRAIDEILGGGPLTGQIIEFFGNAGSGKSILIDTIVVNILEEYDTEVIFIDVKNDFSAMRLHNIMQAKSFPEEVMDRILNNIVVYKANNFVRLMDLLEMIWNQIDGLDSFLVLVIDSLPTIFYQFLGDFNEFNKFLASFTQMIRKIANKYKMVSFCDQ